METDKSEIIYLLPGLGANHRGYIFQQQLSLPIEVLDYTKPISENESIESYAARLIDRMDLSKKIGLIGNSFGGLLSIEIAKQVKIQKTVLVSSVKNKSEMPARIYLQKHFHLYKWISGGQYQFMATQLFHLLGARKGGAIAESIKLMVSEVPKPFISWGVKQIVNWQNEIVPDNVYHIHGTSDEIFPFQLIRNSIPIYGGSHIMIFTKHNEVNLKLLNLFNSHS